MRCARPMSTITAVHGREIIDSRGNPTVEVDVTTSDGLFRADRLMQSCNWHLDMPQPEMSKMIRYVSKVVLSRKLSLADSCLIALKMDDMPVLQAVREAAVPPCFASVCAFLSLALTPPPPPPCVCSGQSSASRSLRPRSTRP